MIKYTFYCVRHKVKHTMINLVEVQLFLMLGRFH